MSGRPTARADGGFTLIELLVALVIMAGMAAVVLPMTGRIPAGLSLRAVAGEVVAQTRSQRMLAMRSGSERSLAIDTATRALTADAGRPLQLPRSIALSIETPTT